MYNVQREWKRAGLIPLVWTHNLGVHSREVEVDVVFLLIGVSLGAGVSSTSEAR